MCDQEAEFFVYQPERWRPHSSAVDAPCPEDPGQKCPYNLEGRYFLKQSSETLNKGKDAFILKFITTWTAAEDGALIAREVTFSAIAPPGVLSSAPFANEYCPYKNPIFKPATK